MHRREDCAADHHRWCRLGGYLDTFDAGFRGVGRGLWFAARWAWRQRKPIATWAAAAIFLHRLVGEPWAAMILSIGPAFAGVGYCLDARKATYEARLTVSRAQLEVAEHDQTAMAWESRALTAENELGMVRAAYTIVAHAAAEATGVLPVSSEGIVGTLALASERLLAVVAGMDDEDRAQRILDAVAVLQRLSGELEADHDRSAAVKAKAEELQRNVLSRIDEAVEQGLKRVREAGAQDVAITLSPRKRP